MKKYFFVLFLFSSGISFAQEQQEAMDRYAAENPLCDIDYVWNGHWIINGAMKRDITYAPDEKVEEGDYVDGKKSGVWTAYFPGGKKKSEIFYLNNRPNGYAVIYFANGNKQEEGDWNAVRWRGQFKRYFSNGIPEQVFNYSLTGIREGQQVYYYENGKVNIEVTMKNGKEDGWKKEYDVTGNLFRETFYVKGEIDKSKTIIHAPPPAYHPPVYYPPVIDTIPRRKPPKPLPPIAEGQMTLYKNGQITMKGIFHNGKLVDGEERIYDSNGLLVQIKIYKSGKYVGDGPLPLDANK